MPQFEELRVFLTSKTTVYLRFRKKIDRPKPLAKTEKFLRKIAKTEKAGISARCIVKASEISRIGGLF